jgi:hypothetical protein
VYSHSLARLLTHPPTHQRSHPLTDSLTYLLSPPYPNPTQVTDTWLAMCGFLDSNQDGKLEFEEAWEMFVKVCGGDLVLEGSLRLMPLQVTHKHTHTHTHTHTYTHTHGLTRLLTHSLTHSPSRARSRVPSTHFR